LTISLTISRGAILEYADWNDNFGSSGSSITDGFYGKDQSTGSNVVSRAPISGDPSPRAGAGLLRMEIHTSDADYGSTGGKRIELKMNQDGSELPYSSANGMGPFGDTYWYAWSVFIPTSHSGDGKQIMGQWICRSSSGSFNPPMGLDLENDQWILTVKDNDAAVNQVKFDLGSVQKGQWTDWAFQIKWDRPNSSDDNTGFIRVYRNGTLLDNAPVTLGPYTQISNDGYTHRGTNTYTATTVGEAANFKLGIYKRTSVTWSAPTRFCYYDEVRVGTDSETLSSMSPGGAPAQPSVVLTPSSVAVPEGGTATAGVKLSSAPSASVTINTARTSGDTDLTVSGGSSLTFTTSNWGTNQNVTLAAAQDADTTNGTAVFTVSGTGVTSATLNAQESDDDSAGGDAATVVASADTYAAGGSTGTNYGTATTVAVKEDGSSSITYDRIGFLKFNLAALASSPTTATLVLTTDATTQAGTITANQVTTDTWTETGLTWSNKPATGTAIGSVSIPASTVTDVSINVTSYIQAQFAGDKTASFALTGTSATLALRSRETGTGDAPTLVFTGGGSGGTTPTIVTTVSSVNVNEGSTGTFGVKLSSAPSANVTVTVARTSGDTDITVSSGSSLTFTTSNWGTNQTVTLAAAQDDDVTNNSATIAASASGLVTVNVTANEVDNDTMSLVVSPTSLSVNEGSTNTYTVRLSNQPAANVTVASARTSGDTDITVSSGSSLTFTTSNWGTNQTVTLAAAQDADTTNGSATIAVTSSGLATVNVTATESDDDVAGDAAPITTSADTYAAGGSTGTNYGTATTVVVKDDGGTAITYDRIGFLKFNLAALASSPTTATLVLTTDATTQAGTMTANQVTTDTWTETGLTWSNKPATDTLIGSVSIPASTVTQVTINVTSYIQAQFAGDKTASFALTGTNAILALKSRETGTSNAATLVFTGGN